MLRYVLILALAVSVAQADDEPAKALSLNLITFNIRMDTKDDGDNQWKLRREFLCDTVRELAPDVMGVQEAFANQLKDMATSLPNYAHVGVGRDDGKAKGEHSSIFYRKDRFEKVADGTFWLSDAPHVVASNTWEAACTRVCTWITLTDLKTKRTVSVYNAHYDHKSVKARENSPRVIVEQMLANKHDKHALVLMGDFNSGPATPQMTYLFDGKAPLTFHNTLPAEQSKTSSTYSGWKGRKEGTQIDYVLVSGDDHKVDSSKIHHIQKDGRYPSDHYPVSAKVTFP